MKRHDGRDPDQLRPIRVEKDWLKFTDGSVLFEMGDTRVLCSAVLEDGVPRWRKGTGEGWVTAEYQMIPGATSDRTPREVRRGGFSGRTQEIQRLIGRAARAVTDLRGLGERTLYLDCEILQADGGTRCAAITASCLAMALALDRAVSAHRIGRVCLSDLLGAVSVGRVDGATLLDLPYEEDSRADVDLNVVMTGRGDLVEIQGTAEGKAFSRGHLEEMLDLAEVGIREIHRVQRETLGEELASAVLDG